LIRTQKYTLEELREQETRAARLDFNTRFERASDKASREYPHIERLTRDSFKVVGEHDDYFVRVYQSDDREFVHCTCEAGTYNRPCYHALAVIFARNVPVKTVERVFGFSPKGVVFTLEAGQSLPAFAGAVRVTVESID